MSAEDQTRLESTALGPEPEQSAPLPPPAKIGKYRVHEEIASGGFGAVYRGEDEATGAGVAIKILHGGLIADARLVRRFEREVEIMRLVQHPSIAEVLEIGRLDDGRPYFVMELLQGETLHSYLRARGRMYVDEALAILTPLVDALGRAHERSVIHRDIKASNVFLASADGQRRVVLLDFGVAKLLDAEGPGITGSRQAVGTLACMAPEQILSRPVDARTDVYALGVLAYRMLTGHPPFADPAQLMLLHMHLHARPPRPSSRAPLSPAIDDVLLRAMSKDQDERQPTAAAFLGELREAARGDISVALPGLVERPVIAVRFEARIEGELPADEDRLFSEIEALPPFVTAELAREGLTVAMDAGTTLLFACDRPADSAREVELRIQIMRAVSRAERQINEHPGRDARVRASFWIHVSTLLVSPDGAAVGGEALEFVSSVPQPESCGVFVSSAALAGIAAEVTPLDEHSDGAFVRLLPDAALVAA